MSLRDIRRLSNEKMLVAPSILAADFSELGAEISKVESAGADMIHVDVMDGHFVPNLTIGPPVVASLRKTSSLPFDVHLMLSNPFSFVKPFAEAGADNITFHVECSDDVGGTICEIRKYGLSAGLSLRPRTSFEALMPYIGLVDLVLIMTVEPGFGGQSFMRDMMGKVELARRAASSTGRHIHVEVDGGIDEKTVLSAAEAGANLFVAGTSVFRSKSGVKSAIESIRSSQSVFRNLRD